MAKYDIVHWIKGVEDFQFGLGVFTVERFGQTFGLTEFGGHSIPYNADFSISDVLFLFRQYIEDYTEVAVFSSTAGVETRISSIVRISNIEYEIKKAAGELISDRLYSTYIGGPTTPSSNCSHALEIPVPPEHASEVTRVDNAYTIVVDNADDYVIMPLDPPIEFDSDFKIEFVSRLKSTAVPVAWYDIGIGFTDSSSWQGGPPSIQGRLILKISQEDNTRTRGVFEVYSDSNLELSIEGFEFDVDYTLMLERVGDLMSAYIDETFIGSYTSSANFKTLVIGTDQSPYSHDSTPIDMESTITLCPTN